MNNFKYLIPLIISLILVGCGGSVTVDATEVPKDKPSVDNTPPMDEDDDPVTPEGPGASTLSLAFTPTKVFSFSWTAVTGATSYKLKEASTTASGYEIIEETAATSFDHVVPLHARLNAKYILQSCNAAGGCTDSTEVFTSNKVAQMTSSIGYFKASNTGSNDYFGNSVTISGDGNTLAVGAHLEDGDSVGINKSQDSNGSSNSGAVYVFTRSGITWSQQAYLKSSNARSGHKFGFNVSLSADGNTLAVGATGEDSNGTGPTNTETSGAGAVYVFTRTSTDSGVAWTEQAYLKAGNEDLDNSFGYSVSLSGDGNTLAVGAETEDSNVSGIGQSGTNDLAKNSGAVYVFTRNSNATWSGATFIKASNTGAYDKFGSSVSLSANGNTLAVGARSEGSNSQTIGAAQDNNGATNAGAVYVFILSSEGWVQQAYLKASNAGEGDLFGRSVSISADGDTLAVGASGEKSNATGINGNEESNEAQDAGAAYVFTRTVVDSSAAWKQEAYIKANNAGGGDEFGFSLSLSADGNSLAVGAYLEGSIATGIDGNQGDVFAGNRSGAVYTFARSAATWSQLAYLKANNTYREDNFGYSTALSDDGTLAVGAVQENRNATGINQGVGQTNYDALSSGAVYLY